MESTDVGAQVQERSLKRVTLIQCLLLVAHSD